MSTLLLAPHNDDETLFAFYTALRERPHVIVVLRSFAEERQGGPSYAVREAETSCAMRLAGCSWEQWEYPDTDPPWPTIERFLGDVLRRYQLVFTPAHEEGGHEHHNEIARIVGRLRREGEGLISYLTYVRGAGRSTGGTEVVPTLYEREQKAMALACYQSQIDWAPTRPWFGADQREFVL